MIQTQPSDIRAVNFRIHGSDYRGTNSPSQTGIANPAPTVRGKVIYDLPSCDTQVRWRPATNTLARALIQRKGHNLRLDLVDILLFTLNTGLIIS